MEAPQLGDRTFFTSNLTEKPLKAVVSLCIAAMASTPDNKSVRPVSAPIIAPWSPQEAQALPLLPIMLQSEQQGACTPRERRCADRKPEEQKKTRSPRPESTPDMKVHTTSVTLEALKGLISFCWRAAFVLHYQPVARRERRHSHYVNAAAEREKKTKVGLCNSRVQMSLCTWKMIRPNCSFKNILNHHVIMWLCFLSLMH